MSLSCLLTVGLIALCYADLASRFTGSGAAWLYSYNAFGRFAGYELGVFTWYRYRLILPLIFFLID